MSTLEESQVLTAPLPARWGVWQLCKNTILYVFIRTAVALVSAAPFALVRPLCLALGRLAALVAFADRKRALAHLAAAFPELSPEERGRIVRRMFEHFGESAAELTHMSRFLSGPHAVKLSAENEKVLRDALAEKKGVVVVTGHIGNWELFAHVIAKIGIPVSSIAKPLYDPRLTRWVHSLRSATGMRVIWRGDNTATKEMMSVFGEGGILALLIDQDTKVQGEFVPFFGRPAHTPTAPAAFALRFGAPLLVAYSHRRRGAHEIHFERLPVVPTGNKEADVLALTSMLSAKLETAIREQPEQWVWLHRRWKKQPQPAAPSETSPQSLAS